MNFSATEIALAAMISSLILFWVLILVAIVMTVRHMPNKAKPKLKELH